jgi:uncharacterized protein
MTRLPEKQSTDRTQLFALLDSVQIAHVGLVADEHPLVVPTGFVRDGDQVLIHGSTGSRWMRTLAAGADACLAVTALDAVVVARSAFESSFQYRSAVLFGAFIPVTGSGKQRALDVIVDGLLPGRRHEVRDSTARELAATSVLALPITRWSLRVSDKWPEDEDADIAGDAWAGVVPMRTAYDDPVPAPDLRADVDVPPSVRALTAKGGTAGAS